MVAPAPGHQGRHEETSPADPDGQGTVVDRDQVFRDALHREAVAVTAHQLEVERAERKSQQRSDVFVGFLLFGATAAVGLKLAERLGVIPKSRSRSSRRRT